MLQLGAERGVRLNAEFDAYFAFTHFLGDAMDGGGKRNQLGPREAFEPERAFLTVADAAERGISGILRGDD